jgi:hypothetical protein
MDTLFYLLLIMITFCHTINANIDFLDSGTYIMDGIVSLHDHILFYEILILTVVI